MEVIPLPYAMAARRRPNHKRIALDRSFRSHARWTHGSTRDGHEGSGQYAAYEPQPSRRQYPSGPNRSTIDATSECARLATIECLITRPASSEGSRALRERHGRFMKQVAKPFLRRLIDSPPRPYEAQGPSAPTPSRLIGRARPHTKGPRHNRKRAKEVNLAYCPRRPNGRRIRRFLPRPSISRHRNRLPPGRYAQLLTLKRSRSRTHPSVGAEGCVQSSKNPCARRYLIR